MADDSVKDAVAEKDAAEKKINQPKGAPLAPKFGGDVVSRETLSHRWQEDSPAIDTNVEAGYAAQNDSVLKKLDTEENLEATKKQEDLQIRQLNARYGTDYDCSLLDVSDARYCHPGSKRHLEYLNKKGIPHDYDDQGNLKQ